MAKVKPAVVGNALLAMIVLDSHVGQMLTAEALNIVAEKHVIITSATTPITLFGSF